MNKKHHQSEIDVLRIIGAISIVLFHYTFRGYAADNMSKLHFPMLGSIFKYGYLGIYLFFTLSGYTVISSIHNKNFMIFIYARLLRLYPSFWVAVCLTTLATLFLGGDIYHIDSLQFFANLTMLNGYIGIKSVDGTYWFLFVILRFYFLISLLILFKIANFHKYIAGIWLGLSFATTIFQIPIIRFFLIPNYAPFLISGMIFYSAKEEGWDLLKFLIVFLSLLLSLHQIALGIPGFNKHYSTDFSPHVIFAIILCIFAFMFFISTNKNQITLSRSFTTLGACTYPLYLIHQNIGFMLFNNFGHIANKYIILTITFFLMVSVSIFIVKYINPYIVNIINKAFKIQTRPTGRTT